MILSKAQVTPWHENILPKLELITVLVGYRLIFHLSQLFSFTNLTLWSDSRVVLTWIANNNETKGVFIANRIAEIFNFYEIDYRFPFCMSLQKKI